MPPKKPQPSAAGIRLRQARVRAGLSQAAAASKLTPPISQSTWVQYELGRRVPTLDWLWRAAMALGCKPSELDERLADPKP